MTLPTIRCDTTSRSPARRTRARKLVDVCFQHVGVVHVVVHSCAHRDRRAGTSVFFGSSMLCWQAFALFVSLDMQEELENHCAAGGEGALEFVDLF